MSGVHEDREALEQRLQSLRQEVAALEDKLAVRPTAWRPGDRDYYGMYHATSGFVLGGVGALASLIFNIVGSLVVQQHPLRLIQVYLTFPLGERALSDEFRTGIALAVGCCLYLATGMILGVPFQMAMARFVPKAALFGRLMLATVLGLILWGINFYGILSWLQPQITGGNWIVDPAIMPPWVGAATHLVFAWTMALIFPLGKFEPYQSPSQADSPVA